MLRGRLSGKAGFTLIELGLVILIIGVMLAITVPRLGNRSYKQLESEARRLALAFRYLRHAAILNGRTYRLMFELDNRAYWAEVSQVTALDAARRDEEELEDDSEFFLDESEREFDQVERFTRDEDGPVDFRRLPEPINFSDVNLPMVAGKVFEGVVWTTFYPDGYVDESVVHLDNGQNVFTVYMLNSITGQVYVEPGYLSLTE